MIAIRLVDDTIIFAKQYEKKDSCIIIKQMRFMKQNEPSRNVSDEMNISNDAIQVYFTTLKGGKPKEKNGPYRRPTPAA